MKRWYPIPRQLAAYLRPVSNDEIAETLEDCLDANAKLEAQSEA